MKRVRSDKVVIELDGAVFQVGWRRGRRLERPGEVVGSKWVITDFNGTTPQLVGVSAPPRYAPLLLLRKLQQAGELDEQGQVLTHWRRAEGGNSTQLLITQVDGQVFGRYRDDAANDPDHHLLFSLHSLLLTALERYGRNRVTAVLFEHGRHIDLMLGRSGRIMAVRRVSTFGDDDQAHKGLVESARRELDSLAREAGIKLERLVYFNWLVTREVGGGGTTTAFGVSRVATTRGDTLTATAWGAATDKADEHTERRIDSDWVGNLASQLEAECQVLKVERIQLEDDEVLLTSTPAVFRHLPLTQSISSYWPQLLYRAHRSAPTATLLLWLITILLFSAGFWLQQSADKLRDEAQVLLREGAGVEVSKLPRIEDRFKETLAFADQLERLRQVPSFQEVLSDVSAARSDKLFIDRTRLEYGENDRIVTVKLDGHIASEFGKASAAHRSFLTALTSLGYAVAESDFSTDVQELRFRLTLRKGSSS